MLLRRDSISGGSTSFHSDPEQERRVQHHECDALIVGAGIIGTALAVTLGKQGRSVILLEKSLKEPDRIVGELLQPGGVEALEKLGLRDCLDDIDAIPVKGYTTIYHGEPVLIPYPTIAPRSTSPSKSNPNPQPTQAEGRSFHHGRFVRRLRQKALATPNVTVVETEAQSLVHNTYTGQILGVTARTGQFKNQDYFFGEQTFITDGHHSTFRKLSSHPHQPAHSSKFHALELIDCPLPFPNHGHVILGDNAPVLLYQIGTHETRALIDIPTSTPTASAANGGVKGHLRNVVLPSLPSQVQDSFSNALARTEQRDANGEIVALKSMPNAYLPPMTNKTPGLLVLGDALNMRHPLTGGGMTVAFNDVVLLSTLLSPERIPSFSDSKAILAAAREFHWRRKMLTSTINILAQALYALFAANDAALRRLQRGCFRYFQQGGECINGPVGLLSGLTKQPLVLFYHFFSVALLSIWIYVVEGDSVKPGAKVEQMIMNGDAAHINGNGQVNGSANGHAKKGDAASKGSEQPSMLLHVLTIPVRMLMSLVVFWKACVVIFPYIFAEMRS